MIRHSDTVSGAHFAFTDRWGGVSAVPYEELNLGGAVGDDPDAVRTNRELAAKSLGLDPARVVWMNQVHGADVAVVSAFRVTLIGRPRASVCVSFTAASGVLPAARSSRKKRSAATRKPACI